MQSGFLHYSFHPGLEISRGQVRRLTPYHISGSNSYVTSGSLEVVGPVQLWSFPASPDTVDVFSDAAADTLAGTGAQKVLLEGIDASGDAISEEIEMAGFSFVTSTLVYEVVNRMTVVQVGSGNSQAGKISCRHTTLGVAINKIDSDNKVTALTGGWGVSQQAVYKVCNDHRGYITSWNTSLGGLNTGTLSGDVTFHLWINRNATSVWHLQSTQALAKQDNATSSIAFDIPLIAEPGDTILVSARGTSGGAGCHTSVSLILEDI